MCEDCKYSKILESKQLSSNRFLCMNEDLEYYGKCVPATFVCDEYKPNSEEKKIKGIKECLKILFEDSSDEELENMAKKCYESKKEFENIIKQNKKY